MSSVIESLAKFDGGNVLESAASVPLDPLEISVWVVAQAVQAATKGHAAARRRAVWVLVVCVEGSMVVEVLLDVDERDVVLGEQLSNASSVFRLVAGHVVPVENLRESGDVERQDIECSRVLSDAQRDQRGEGQGRGKEGMHFLECCGRVESAVQSSLHGCWYRPTLILRPSSTMSGNIVASRAGPR